MSSGLVCTLDSGDAVIMDHAEELLNKGKSAMVKASVRTFKTRQWHTRILEHSRCIGQRAEVSVSKMLSDICFAETHRCAGEYS